jgi:hypothetical protein
MRYYTELARYERDGFGIIVDKTWEDIDPWDQLSECFDDQKQLYADIDNGKYEWFMLRVRVMVEDLELATEYLGGCLYERAEDVLTDGTAEDLVYQAIEEAKGSVYRLSKKFADLSAQVDREALSPYNTLNS